MSIECLIVCEVHERKSLYEGNLKNAVFRWTSMCLSLKEVRLIATKKSSRVDGIEGRKGRSAEHYLFYIALSCAHKPFFFSDAESSADCGPPLIISGGCCKTGMPGR